MCFEILRRLFYMHQKGIILYYHYHWGFLGGSDGKESTCNAGELASIPGSGRSPGGGHGNPLQCSCLEDLQGQRSLVDYSPWSHKESDTTERLNTHSVIITTIYTHLFHPLKFTLDMVLTEKPVLPTAPHTPPAPHDETLFLAF